MNLNLNSPTIKNQIVPIKNFVYRYSLILFILFVVVVLGFMTIRISYYSNLEPNEFQIEEKQTLLKPVKLDDNAVSKVNELQEKNITIESLFDNGRANPFQ